MLAIEETAAEDYRPNTSIDLAKYYSDVIGVTKSPGQRDCEVVFWIDNENAPYLITKPLHASQIVEHRCRWDDIQHTGYP